MIEKHNDWIYTEVIFTRSGKQRAEIDYENLGIAPPEEELENVPFRFNIRGLIAYNRGDSSRNTILRLMDGYSYAIGVPFDQFIREKCKRKWYE